MGARIRSWWQKIKTHPIMTAIIIVAGVLVTALIVVVVLGYCFNWPWVGVSGGNSKITTTTTATEQPPAKTLWDWLNLLGVLAIPVVVGFGAAWFTAQQGKVSERENKDNQREKALQDYIDKMSELLLDKNNPLRESKPEDEVRKIARVRTLTVLRNLDPTRKGSLLSFLSESGLILKDMHGGIISLEGADFSLADLNTANPSNEPKNTMRWMREHGLYWGMQKAKLSRVNLKGAKLGQTSLKEADLSEAYLSHADLENAKLEGADLHGARMRHAILECAILTKADLQGADLFEADLTGANLKGVTGITNAEIEKQVKSLKGATMPDGSIHP
jgi:uncharacterized protein YjbI with pentapeptide repeats